MNVTQEYKQTEFGPIPSDWILCTFQDVLTTFSSGATPYRGIPEYYKGNVRWISSGELNYNKILDTVEHISQQAVRNANLRVHQPGTFLMAITGLEAEGTRGRCAFIGAPATTNQSCLAINGTERMCTEYLFWFYRMWGQYLAFKYCQGTKQQSYTASIVRNLPIYGPKDIAEQQAIAEALSDIDGLIAALDRKIAKKRLIKQGAMQQLLTGKKRLPGFADLWVEKKLGEIVYITTGRKDVNEGSSYGAYPFFTCSTLIMRSNSYSFDKEAILIAGNGDVGNLHYYNGKFEAYQRTYVLYDFIENVQYLYLYLQAFLIHALNDGKVGSTIPYIVLTQLTDFVVKLPQDKAEQTAIATILTDMDKEIADLETKRDKYRLLKSGMMQKLLTGQIRLTKPLIKVVPLVPELSAAREIPVDAHILAGHIVNRLWQSKGWGRTKLQKSLHLIGYCVQLNLGNEYIRNTAGPDDQLLMNYIDQKFKQYRHVNIKKERRSDGTVHYSYIPTPLIQELEMAYEQYPQNIREHIDVLLDKLSTTNLAGAEILSTLYAVWNNRIIKGEQITDDLLLADFYAWSQHKADFEEIRVRNALDYMRKENIVPIGWGKYIDKR
ncbi:restriction endonuclease subunit S [Alistipes shahii]|jgi:type I restriction enzyme, S subunit|uniref:restriction endonuclease subunit S n=1 Tax=Alistipes shahii TaxID=328814 RepID=UPI00266F980C|nr:restriction endonuclease subunit S [Alistipes shahii]